MSERKVSYEGVYTEAQAKAVHDGGPTALLAQMEKEVAEQDAAVQAFDKAARLKRARAYLKAAGNKPAAPDFPVGSSRDETEWIVMGGNLADLHALEGDDVAASVATLAKLTGEPIPVGDPQLRLDESRPKVNRAVLSAKTRAFIEKSEAMVKRSRENDKVALAECESAPIYSHFKPPTP